MGKLKSALCFLMILCSLFVFTGCWNYREIERMGIVSSGAIDKGEGAKKYHLSVEVYKEKGGGEQGATIPHVISSRGRTVFSAIRNTIAETGRQLYWSHVQAFVFSDAVAKDGMVPALDFITRAPEIRYETYLLIAKDRSAKEILASDSHLAETIGTTIGNLEQTQERISKFPAVQLWHFLEELHSEGIEPILPAVSTIAQNGMTSLRLSGCAVFKGDKLIGWLDEDSTTYLQWVKNRLRGAVLVLDDVGEEKITAALEIYGSKVELKPTFDTDKPKMIINIQCEVVIAEINGNINLMEKDRREALKRDVEKKIEYEVKNVIKSVQKEYGSDIFGFGATLKRKAPAKWKLYKDNWGEIFKELETDITAEVKIKGSQLYLKQIEVVDHDKRQ